MRASLGPRPDRTEQEEGKSWGCRSPQIENKLEGAATRWRPGRLGSSSTLPAAKLFS